MSDEEWPTETIASLIEKGVIIVHKDGNHGSKYPRANEFGDIGVPFLTAKLLDDRGNIDLAKAPRLADEKADKFTFGFIETDDVLLSHNATVGRVAVVPELKERMLIGTSLTLYRLDKTKLLPKYLAAYFSGREFKNQLASVMSQTTRNQVPITSQRNLSIVIPPLSDQERIANMLSSFDDKIELNRQTNQTLEQIAQTIFKSWFADFEHVKAKVKAKQNGQNPELAAMCVISGKTEEQLKGLDEAPLQQLKTTAALFPDTMVESALGEIPEGWVTKPFGEMLSKTIGGDWGKEERDEKHTEKVKILRGTDLPNVYAGDDSKVPTRFVESKKLATRKLESGDIVIEVSGGSPTQPTGRSLFLTEEIISRLDADLEPASFCRLFRPVDKKVGLILGLHLQRIYADGKTWLYQNQSTGISNFQTTVFLEKEFVVLPPNKIMNAFYEVAMPYLQKISSGENKKLGKIRDTLLPKLLSGELNSNKEVA